MESDAEPRSWEEGVRAALMERTSELARRGERNREAERAPREAISLPLISRTGQQAFWMRTRRGVGWRWKGREGGALGTLPEVKMKRIGS